MTVRRIMPYRESPDFEATRAFYTRVLGLEEGRFGGGYIEPVDEHWGVRRFFVRDPRGVVISVPAHE